MSMYKVTHGMSRVLSRRPKRVCDGCGLTIPIYPGRYPKRCPSCGESFIKDDPIGESLIDDDPIDKIVEMLTSDDISIDRALLEMEGGDVDSEKELAIDKLMQRINVVDLLDPLVGVEVSANSENIWVYFADTADEEDLKRLADELRPFALAIELYPSDKPGTAWCMSVLNPRKEDKPTMAGTVDTQADLSGDVDVNQAGA